MKKHIWLSLLFLCCNAFSEPLIPLTSLINQSNLNTVKINPAGNLLVTSHYEKLRLTVSIIDISSQRSHVIYRSKSVGKEGIRQALWLDNNSLYLQTYQKNLTVKQKYWLIDITKGFHLQHKIQQINARGNIIDPLPHLEDQVIFQTYTGNNIKRQRIFHTNTQALIRDNFRTQQAFDNELKDCRYYRTDQQHKIRFCQTYQKEERQLTHWYLDNDNTWQKLYRHNYTTDTFHPVGFLANGKLVVISNIISDQKSLYEFDVKKQSFGQLLYQHPQYDLTAAQLSQDQKNISAVSYLNEGEWHTEYFKSTQKKIQKVASNTFKNQQYKIVSTSNDENILVLFVFSSSNSGDYYVWDTKANKALYIGKRYTKHTNLTFQPSETLKIKSPNGHVIEAFYTPANPSLTNNVLLVMPHGGPIGVRDKKSFNAKVQYFSNRGYAILQVNYRGSTGFGKQHLNQGRGQWGKNIEADITTAVSALRQKHPFKFMCSIGGSYGAYSSVMLAIQHPNDYHCVIASFGVFDLPLLFNDRNTKITAQKHANIARVVGENNTELLTQSPVYFVNKLNTPTLITAGFLDKRASFEHSNRLKYVLTQHGKDVEHLYYRRAAHGHHSITDARHELAYIHDFITRKLALPLVETHVNKRIQASEYKRIAQGFNDKNHVGVDKEKYRLYMQKYKELLATIKPSSKVSQ